MNPISELKKVLSLESSQIAKDLLILNELPSLEYTLNDLKVIKREFQNKGASKEAKQLILKMIKELKNDSK